MAGGCVGGTAGREFSNFQLEIEMKGGDSNSSTEGSG